MYVTKLNVFLILNSPNLLLSKYLQDHRSLNAHTVLELLQMLIHGEVTNKIENHELLFLLVNPLLHQDYMIKTFHRVKQFTCKAHTSSCLKLSKGILARDIHLNQMVLKYFKGYVRHGMLKDAPMNR